MFLGTHERQIVARMIRELYIYGVANTSQVIRTALRYWDQQHSPAGMAGMADLAQPDLIEIHAS